MARTVQCGVSMAATQPEDRIPLSNQLAWVQDNPGSSWGPGHILASFVMGCPSVRLRSWRFTLVLIEFLESIFHDWSVWQISPGLRINSNFQTPQVLRSLHCPLHSSRESQLIFLVNASSPSLSILRAEGVFGTTVLIADFAREAGRRFSKSPTSEAIPDKYCFHCQTVSVFFVFVIKAVCP